AMPPSVAVTRTTVSVIFFMMAPFEFDFWVRLHRTRSRVCREANSRKKVLELFRFVCRNVT
ncbi:MAG: hypothetical protein J0I36_14315, partial [Pandoraea sp.]|nr:hypothetical protein [Pandoraea sp.]